VQRRKERRRKPMGRRRRGKAQRETSKIRQGAEICCDDLVLRQKKYCKATLRNGVARGNGNTAATNKTNVKTYQVK
jgi:hypothetical protein